jgi:Fic family protein
MSLHDRLRLLQELSGLPQVELARKLGVSFVTFNRWINEKAIPRAAAAGRIERLLQEYLGTREVVTDPLLARKAALFSMAKRSPSILQTILQRSDLLDEFALRLTYTSNRIEGSTLTEAETAAVLFDDVAVPRKALADQLAAKNHQAAFLELLRLLQSREPIGEDLVLRLHGMLMNGLTDDAGRYRTHGVRIVGSDIPTANYLSVPRLMQELAEDIPAKEEDIIRHSAAIHARFEQIHPFSDGNGRIGRLLLHAMLLGHNLPPVVIRPEKKRQYYNALAHAQRGNGPELLEMILCTGMLEGFRVVRGE